MRLPVFIAAVAAAFAIQAQSLHTEPTYSQAERLIAAAKGEEYSPPDKPYLYSKPTFGQFERLITAVRESGASGDASAETNAAAIAALETGVRTNAASIAALEKATGDALEGKVDVDASPLVAGAGAAASEAAVHSVALGDMAEVFSERSVALGYKAQVASGKVGAIQLGAGVNSTSYSLQFRGTPVVGADGKIPASSLDTRFATTGEVAEAVAAIPAPDFTANNQDLVALVTDLVPHSSPVTGVNGKTGEVAIAAADVGAYDRSETDRKFDTYKPTTMWAADSLYVHNATGELFKCDIVNSKWTTGTTVYSFRNATGDPDTQTLRYNWGDAWRYIEYNPYTGLVRQNAADIYGSHWSTWGYQAAGLDPTVAGTVLTNMVGTDQYGNHQQWHFTAKTETPGGTPYDRFATTNDLAEAIAAMPTPDFTTNNTALVGLVADLMPTNAPVMSVNGKTGVVEIVAADVGAYTRAETDAAIAGIKPTRVYNAAGTDALDDKGQLFRSIVYEAKYTVTRDSSATPEDFVYSGCDDGHVYRFALTTDPRAEIRYDSSNGKLYTAFNRGTTGWWLTDLRTVDSGLNPERGDVLPGYTNGWYAINQVGSNAASVVYTPRNSDFDTTPYARFALESIPDRAWTNDYVYSYGDIVNKDGVAYRYVNTVSAAGEWSAESWQEIPVLSEKASRAELADAVAPLADTNMVEAAVAGAMESVEAGLAGKASVDALVGAMTTFSTNYVVSETVTVTPAWHVTVTNYAARQGFVLPSECYPITATRTADGSSIVIPEGSAYFSGSATSLESLMSYNGETLLIFGVPDPDSTTLVYISPFQGVVSDVFFGGVPGVQFASPALSWVEDPATYVTNVVGELNYADFVDAQGRQTIVGEPERYDSVTTNRVVVPTVPEQIREATSGLQRIVADVASALSGNLYDFSLDADRTKALEDVVRVLGGSVTNSAAVK